MSVAVWLTGGWDMVRTSRRGPINGIWERTSTPREGPSPVCCFLCSPWDAGLVALGQWQGYHNLCWGWIQPWNGQVGSMKKPCSAVVIISGAPEHQTAQWHQTLSVTDTWELLVAGELEPGWRVLGVEI